MTVGVKPPKVTREEEQQKTYSYPVSLTHRWMNLLFLNFGYHNAHHHKATVPWHSLPNLNSQLLEGDQKGTISPRILPFTQLLENFHKYRVKRIYSVGHIEFDQVKNQMDISNFFGVLDASFLVLEL